MRIGISGSLHTGTTDMWLSPTLSPQLWLPLGLYIPFLTKLMVQQHEGGSAEHG